MDQDEDEEEEKEEAINRPDLPKVHMSPFCLANRSKHNAFRAVILGLGSERDHRAR